MEKSTPIGLGVGFVLIFGTILMGDGWTTFLDPGSLLIVLGGMTAALFVAFSMQEMMGVLPALKAFLAFQEPDLRAHVDELADLARLARREGLLALDRRLGETENELLRLGLEMMVDGVEPQEIEELMRAQLEEGLRTPHLFSRVCDTAGLYAPAFGMIGTLIGLIQMLQNLNDPSAIGPAMAVAMITTFYGAFVANLIFLPLANKSKKQRAVMAQEGHLLLTGVLGLARGDSPNFLEKRLRAFVGGEEDPAAADDSAPALAQAA
ncbi:MAG: MotA/TolQ/ExbB proton channel family protein [Bacteroidota bacterium]